MNMEENIEYQSIGELEEKIRHIQGYRKMYYRVRRFIKDVPYNIRKIQWFIQRGKRGWADCDWWGMDYYLISIILPMLKELKKNQHGHPADLTEEKWNKILDEMVEGFEAAERALNDEYVDKFQPNWFESNEKLTKETLNKCLEETIKDQKIFKEKMKVFVKYFFGLWD